MGDRALTVMTSSERPTSNVAAQRVRPTIHDVAARAGVSKSLVSLVLREQPHVRPEKREAVLRAVDELGYRPNAAARNLAARHSRTVGVLVLDLHNPVFVEVLDGLRDGFQVQAVTELLVSGGGDPRLERRLLDSLVDLQVDGLVLVGHRLDRTSLDRLAGERPLVVVTRRDHRRPGLDTVCNDDVVGARLAVDHLAGLGHRRIWHLGGGDSSVAVLRRDGYEQAMRRRGLGAQVRVVQAGLTDDAGYAATTAALRSAEPPTALFVANDYSALGALAAVEHEGLQVPQDVAVVGYDGMALSGMRRIDLTTVAQPLGEMGRLAADLLSSRMQEPGRRARNVLLQPELVVRSSTVGTSPVTAPLVQVSP